MKLPTHLDDHAGHVLPEEVPAVAVPLRDESELGDDEVDVHLGGHVHEAAPEAVLREDQEDVLQDGAHVLRAEEAGRSTLRQAGCVNSLLVSKLAGPNDRRNHS